MKIGFIGTGNMGTAILKGALSSNTVDSSNIIASARNDKKKEEMDILGVSHTADNKKIAADSDILVLGVKPNIMNDILDEIKESVDDKKIVISIAAGINMSDIENKIGLDKKVVRVMPNTPALVGESMSAICINKNISDNDISRVCEIFSSIGKYEIVDESLMDSVIGVSGSSPAYVYIMIEAMADAAVRSGMKRDKAYRFAAQSVLGAAKMVLESGIHPAELKDMVCSPAGTTIEAVAMLEKMGFRSAIIEAQSACVRKSKEMSKR